MASPKRLRPATLCLFAAALCYSIFLFFIASRLPGLTKKAAAALTWVVYSQIVKGLITYLAAIFVFITFIKWPSLKRKWHFLISLVLFSAATAHFISRLGDSVNEYVHYPQYGTLVILWYVFLKKAIKDGVKIPPRLPGRSAGPGVPAVIIAGLLGICEEGSQYFIPLRVFDIQDILLNFMGVWFGVLIIRLFERDSLFGEAVRGTPRQVADNGYND